MRGSLAAALLLFAGCGGPDVGATPPLALLTSSLVGGIASFDDEAVFLLRAEYPGVGVQICSATLVGARSLLTSAHCVAPQSGVVPSVSAVSGVRPSADASIRADRVGVHPAHRPGAFSADLALVRLEVAPRVRPLAVDFGEVPSATTEVRAVGYGVDQRGDVGTRRTALLKVREVRETSLELGSDAAAACSGDSGGPALLDEALVAIHSFDLQSCQWSSALRVSPYQAFIAEWLAEAEASSCAFDARCLEGCAPPDPDCGCESDGACNPRCGGLDADCPASCVANGVCSMGGCAEADVDCAGVGAPCGLDSQCASRRCGARPGEASRCLEVCVSGSCASGSECVSGVCLSVPPLLVGSGEACDSQTRCAERSEVCGLSFQGTPSCQRRCLDAQDCIGIGSCVEVSPGVSACRPVRRITRLPVQLPAARGCAAVDGSGGLVALLALAVGKACQIARRARQRQFRR